MVSIAHAPAGTTGRSDEHLRGMPLWNGIQQNAALQVTPEMAADWLAACEYGRQRPISYEHVAELRDAMQGGAFEPTTITFVTCEEDDRTYLVDGYHRLHAIAAYGQPVPLFVTRRWVATRADVAAIYGRLDRGRSRSIHDVVRAHNVAEVTQLSHDFLSRMTSALVVVASEFRGQQAVKRISHSADLRISLLHEWVPEMLAFSDGIAGSHIGHRLRAASIASVALVTFRHQPAVAATFWRNVAMDDGLRKGMPEHALVRFIQENPVQKVGAESLLRAVIMAWNAAFQGRQIAFVRAVTERTPINIAGTPYRGK